MDKSGAGGDFHICCAGTGSRPQEPLWVWTFGKKEKKSGSALGRSKALVEKQTLTVYDSAESIAELRGSANRYKTKEQHLTVDDSTESIAELRLRVSR